MFMPQPPSPQPEKVYTDGLVQNYRNSYFWQIQIFSVNSVILSFTYSDKLL